MGNAGLIKPPNKSNEFYKCMLMTCRDVQRGVGPKVRRAPFSTGAEEQSLDEHSTHDLHIKAGCPAGLQGRT